MKKFRAGSWIMLVLAVFFFWSCGGGGGGGSVSGSGGGTGTLSLGLVDAPGGNYKAVYVTIGQVQVCRETGPCDGAGDGYDCECQWDTITTVNRTYNLLELVNGVMVSLGQKDLEAGIYHQMRLLLYDVPDDTLNILGNEHPFPQYVIDEDDVVHAMKVPSGYQTGIKLVHSFEIVSGLTTELILDFDVARSVVKAGNSGKYILKPTIKVIGTYNRATVSGIVTSDEDTPVPLEGAMVTAWYQDMDDNWIAAMSTMTDATGAYMLYLDLGGPYELDSKDYKIVAMADGYEPACTSLTVMVDQTYPDTDFALAETVPATVTGTITGALPAPYPDENNPPIVTVSFNRQVGDCVMDPVETDFVQVSDDEGTNIYNSADGTFQYTYTIELPAGVYDVTASGEGLTTIEVTDFNTAAGTLDFGPM